MNLRFKLIRKGVAYPYKGLLVNGKIRSFFLGRICEEREIPFSKEILDIYKRYGYIQVVSGIEVKYSKILLFIQSIFPAI